MFRNYAQESDGAEVLNFSCALKWFYDFFGVKDVAAKYGYQNYFYDMFVGDFSHCTKKGNRILAESIANVILKEVFGK